MSDIEYLTAAAKRFYAEIGISEFKGMQEYYEYILSIDGAFAKIINGKGFIVGLISPSFLNPNIKLCSELAFYVDKEYRGTSTAVKLLKMYEQHAIDNGCNQINLVSLEKLDAETVSNIYGRLGYNLLEKHFIKEL